MRSRLRVCVLLLACALAALSACGDDDRFVPPPPVPTATSTVTRTVTAVASRTATPTAVAPSQTPTAPSTTTPSQTATKTVTPIEAATSTATITETPTATPTATMAGTATPTVPSEQLAALGETAFFDTLFGLANREEEAIALLGAAVANDAADGRSQFLLGMMHFYRFGQALTDWRQPSDFAKSEIVLANAALDDAVIKLPSDTRIPGFRGAATYANGVVHGDDGLRDLGLQQVRDSIPLYPAFNAFSFVGAVADVVPPGDPLFAEALGYIEAALATCSPFTDPKICGNEGKAAHNLQGSMLLFGDLYAKAGDATKAQQYYDFGLVLDGPHTWPFRALAEERVANLAARIALYQDEDPTNDPRLSGVGQAACATCHYK